MQTIHLQTAPPSKQLVYHREPASVSGVLKLAEPLKRLLFLFRSEEGCRCQEWIGQLRGDASAQFLPYNVILVGMQDRRVAPKSYTQPLYLAYLLYKFPESALVQGRIVTTAPAAKRQILHASCEYVEISIQVPSAVSQEVMCNEPVVPSSEP